MNLLSTLSFSFLIIANYFYTGMPLDCLVDLVFGQIVNDKMLLMDLLMHAVLIAQLVSMLGSLRITNFLCHFVGSADGSLWFVLHNSSYSHNHR